MRPHGCDFVKMTRGGEGAEGLCFWPYLSAVEQATCPEDVHICPVPMCGALMYCTPDSHSAPAAFASFYLNKL